MKHSKKIAVLCLSLLFIGGLSSTMRRLPAGYPQFKPAIETESIKDLDM